MLRTKNHGRRTADGGHRTDIWITKSLPELSSGETKTVWPTKISMPFLSALNNLLYRPIKMNMLFFKVLIILR